MTGHIVFRSSPVDRRQPLLMSSPSDSSYSSGGSRRFAELAGGATAECAAIACCCPCGIATLLYLAVYKVPAGLCRRALRMKRRRRMLKKGSSLPPIRHRCECGCEDTELQIHALSGSGPMVIKSMEMDEDVMELEKEMWDRFYSTGFWRSLSQRAQ